MAQSSPPAALHHVKPPTPPAQGRHEGVAESKPEPTSKSKSATAPSRRGGHGRPWDPEQRNYYPGEAQRIGAFD